MITQTADHLALRDRIAETLARADGWEWAAASFSSLSTPASDRYRRQAEAVLAALDALKIRDVARQTAGHQPAAEETPRLVVKEETRRYAEQLRAAPGKASADGHTGWECTAGASLIAEATTPGPGRLGTLHATIYTCPSHRTAAEQRITAGGYTPLVDDAPPGHRWDPWPCGHMTAYKSGALDALSTTPAPATKICGGPETDDKGNPLIQHINRYLDWAQSPSEGCISLTPDGADAHRDEPLPEGKDFAAEEPRVCLNCEHLVADHDEEVCGQPDTFSDGTPYKCGCTWGDSDTADAGRQNTQPAADEPEQHAEEAPDRLAHVGWWCWRGDNHGHLATQACRSDNVPIHVPTEWADDMRAVISRIEDGDEQPTAELTAAERKFLTFALDRAVDALESGSGFTHEDDAALARLRRLAAGAES